MVCRGRSYLLSLVSSNFAASIKSELEIADRRRGSGRSYWCSSLKIVRQFFLSFSAFRGRRCRYLLLSLVSQATSLFYFRYNVVQIHSRSQLRTIAACEICLLYGHRADAGHSISRRYQVCVAPRSSHNLWNRFHAVCLLTDVLE